MATKVTRRNSLYGYPNPQMNAALEPIVARRAPNANDKYEIGQVWVDTVGNATYTLTSFSAGAPTWTGGGGGTGDFDNLTVSQSLTLPGGATVTSAVPTVATFSGVIQSTGGIVTTSLNASTGITANTIQSATTIQAQNDITSNTGNILATAGYVQGGSLVTLGDEGSIMSGITFTNVTDETLSTGVVTFNTTTANNSSNTGWMKIYVDADVRYIPYVTDIAP